MKKIFVVSVFLVSWVSILFAKQAANYPYIQSGLDGFYYVRSIPEDNWIQKGYTEVYKVGKETDELIDTYNWYSRGQLFLGWSPKIGKVAVISLEDKENPMQEELKPKKYRLSFYLGGKHLRTYTSKDLSEMGLIREVVLSYGVPGDFKIIGVQQIPGTNDNDYVFSLQKEDNSKIISFDITTGELYQIKK